MTFTEEDHAAATRMVADFDGSALNVLGEDWLVEIVVGMLSNGTRLHVEDVGSPNPALFPEGYGGPWPAMVAVAITGSERLAVHIREAEITDPANPAAPGMSVEGWDYTAAYQACAAVAGEAARAAAQADLDLDPAPVA